MPTPEFSVAGHLKKVPRAVRPTVQAARRTVKAAAPKAQEIAYQSKPPRSSRMMWKLARYAVDGAYVVAIGTFPKHATLFFYRGSALDDGSGLLQGSGKDLRFITLNAPADAERPAVKRIVRRAFALERSATRSTTR
jgi:hypothetical protein